MVVTHHRQWWSQKYHEGCPSAKVNLLFLKNEKKILKINFFFCNSEIQTLKHFKFVCSLLFQAPETTRLRYIVVTRMSNICYLGNLFIILLVYMI